MPARLHLRCAAHARHATELRGELAEWSRGLGLPEQTRDAIAIAAYEAMANVVTHAYPAGTTGVLELRADRQGDGVAVVVSDRGRWRTPPADPGILHGRGLPLIHALSDHAEIRPAAAGTTVTLTWHVDGAAGPG
ncbi:ATP-binding protein [Prauserella flavalba]|uniref:ATP-binding protein n=1 Tax=Prauserella flavalba TaxID=1477506 RepID=UPI001FEC675F|nr:ATP-binding protein [Prauserella flavalba]